VGQMDLSLVLHGDFELKMGQNDLSLVLQKKASLVGGKLWVLVFIFWFQAKASGMSFRVA
jgi:hypothetical protein